MIERIPYLVFDRLITSPPLRETPGIWNEGSLSLILDRAHQTVIDAYNSGLLRLLDRGAVLEQRRQNGEFDRLGEITARIEAGERLIALAGQLLIRDFGTLLDARDASYGRRNLNLANYVDSLNQLEARGTILDVQQRQIRENYQAGDFHLIPGGNYPLDLNTKVDRYEVPVEDGGKSYSIFDGAPVEGIIRNLDREIAELQARRDISAISRWSQLRNLRHQRDVLFTSSTFIYREDNDVTHARKQYEAKLKSEDPILSEWEKPDWYKIELSLRDRRVLNLPRGRARWGCLPLLLPLIVAIPLFSLCGRPEAVPVPPVVQEEDCSNGTTPQIFKDPNASYDGHIAREFEAAVTGRSQREYISNDNEDFLAGLLRIEEGFPGFREKYLEIRKKDAFKAASKAPGKKGPVDPENPIVRGTDFPDEFGVVYQCLTVDETLQQAKEAISR